MNRPALLLLLAAAGSCGGCAALTHPVADGVPARRVPAEVLGRPRADLRPLPLTLLRQKEPAAYRLDRGDVLAVVADDVLGPAGQPAPVRLPDRDSPGASVGYPVPVNDDGTIHLPRLAPIPVKGKTTTEVEALIRDSATGKLGGVELVKPGVGRFTAQLLSKRTYQVLVIREDAGGVGPVGSGGGAGLGSAVLGVNRRGTGTTLRLPAYENDVLRALTATGGLPGTDARNEVTVIRGQTDPSCPAANTTRIPLRIYPDQPVTLRDEDVILGDGDVVYIEARDTEFYYTAGLIGGGQFLLPRDYDLRVTEAIAQVRGPLANGGFSQNAFIASSTNGGLGNPNTTLLTVLRRLPNGRQIPIRVDLDRALQDLRENILVRPGDMLVLQERPGYAIVRYLTQTFKFNTVAQTIESANIQQTLTGVNP